jgi:hypothetical protein
VSQINRYFKSLVFFSGFEFQQIVNGHVGAVANRVAKVVVVEYSVKQGIKTTMVDFVMVKASITKIATPTVAQVSVDI